MVGEREETEQAAAQHGIGEGAHRHAVVPDPGEIEVFVQQAGVRLGVAEHDRHALEGHAIAHRVDDAPHDDAHFVVGIGSGPHRSARRRSDVVAAPESITAPSRSTLAQPPRRPWVPP